MDWPGAQEMAKRFAKTIDPKIIGDDEDNPALAAAKQQMEAMNQELQQLHGMLQNVQNSFEARDAEVKEFKAQVDAYNAETNRIKAVQTGMSPEQIQDIVMGTLHAAMDTGDIVAGSPEMRENPATPEPYEVTGEMPEQPIGGMPQ